MGFSATWLALREPADHAARDRGLLQAAVRAAGDAPVIVDLGCGTGSTLRAFEGELGQMPEWRLVDNDPALLDQAAQAAAGPVSAHQLDLRSLAAVPLDTATLVTASALLDLCSQVWLEELAALLARNALPFYAALNYDGDMRWTPADPDDAAVRAAFNRHQQSDKGFGPALGPNAASAIARVFGPLGYHVVTADSPWRLDRAQAALQAQLLQGIASAAAAAGEAQAEDWLHRRLALIDSSTCLVGHVDLLALPPAPGTEKQ